MLPKVYNIEARYAGIAGRVVIRNQETRAALGAPRALSIGPGQSLPGRHSVGEREAVARFAATINAIGSLAPATPALQARLLEEVKIVAQQVNASIETGKASGYDRRVLHEDFAGWSLAAIILRPGQRTQEHDHGSWGCAVTVQGIERNRRIVQDGSGRLILKDEQDYPKGAGYVFNAVDIHQPIGADPERVTVALHFLAPADADLVKGSRPAEMSEQEAENVDQADEEAE